MQTFFNRMASLVQSETVEVIIPMNISLSLKRMLYYISQYILFIAFIAVFIAPSLFVLFLAVLFCGNLTLHIHLESVLKQQASGVLPFKYLLGSSHLTDEMPCIMRNCTLLKNNTGLSEDV